MNESRLDGICNLTIAAGRIPLDEGAGPLKIADRLLAEILDTKGLEEKAHEAIACEVLYVALSGDSLIEQDDGTTVIFTAGDVVFVPAQARHRFTQLSRKFKTWRIRF